MTDHNYLIEKLGRDIKPVCRTWRPGWRMLAWLAMAMPCAAIASLLVHRDMADWSAAGSTVAIIQQLLAFSLGALAVRRAFTLSMAGYHSMSWAALLPIALLCLALNLWSLSPQALPEHSEQTNCFIFLTVVSTPMIVLMIISLRRTRSLYPVRSLAMAGLGIASLATSLLTFCHPPEVHPLDFVMHLAAIATIVALTVLGGIRWIGLDR